MYAFPAFTKAIPGLVVHSRRSKEDIAAIFINDDKWQNRIRDGIHMIEFNGRDDAPWFVPGLGTDTKDITIGGGTGEFRIYRILHIDQWFTLECANKLTFWRQIDESRLAFMAEAEYFDQTITIAYVEFTKV